jgi:tetratricopeptide (TPR) repeat protein
VLQAIATAAQRMRAKLGESLSSIRKLAPPFDSDRVTTSSLEAFQAYSSGAELYRQGRYSEAVTFLQRATELDANLARGWNVLAVAYYSSGGSRERFEEYQDRAWALQDRVSAQERFWITSGRGTLGENVAAAEIWARTYPRDATPVVVLGHIYANEGEFDDALAKFQEAYRPPTSFRRSSTTGAPTGGFTRSPTWAWRAPRRSRETPPGPGKPTRISSLCGKMPTRTCGS